MVISGRLQYFRPILATKVNVGADSLIAKPFGDRSNVTLKKCKMGLMQHEQVDQYRIYIIPTAVPYTLTCPVSKVSLIE